jgi:hypothetical protein
VERSILSDNRYGQLVFSGPRTRSWSDHVTQVLITMGDFADWTLLDNRLASSGSAPLIYSPVVPIADWQQLLLGGEIVAAGNEWARPAMDGAIKIQATSYSMDEWRDLTGDVSPDPEDEATTTSTTTTTTPAPTTTTVMTTSTTSTTASTTTTVPTEPAPSKGSKRKKG